MVAERNNGALVKVTGTPVSGGADIVLWTGKPKTYLENNQSIRSFDIVLAETHEQMKDFRLDFHDPRRSSLFQVLCVWIWGLFKPPVEGANVSS